MSSASILWLSEPDLIAAGVLDFARCVNVLEETFHLIGKQDYLMGGHNHNEHGQTIFFPKSSPFPNMPLAGPDRRFTTMVAYLGGRFNICCNKWYGSHVTNPSIGLPRSVHTIVLNRPDTCMPLTMMSGNLVSAVRTGSVPGFSTRYLAKKNASTCAIIGAGPINRAALQGIVSQVKTLHEIVVYDLFADKAQAFADWAMKKTSISARVAASLEEAVRSADIVNVAAAGAKSVYILDEWIPKGALVILTGAARFDDAALLHCNIVYDNPWMQEAYLREAEFFESKEEFYATLKGGQFFRLIDEGKLPEFQSSLLLSSMVENQQSGRTDQEQRFIYLTAGMSVFDAAWSFECYLNARRLGLGQQMKLWDEPYWI